MATTTIKAALLTAATILVMVGTGMVQAQISIEQDITGGILILIGLAVFYIQQQVIDEAINTVNVKIDEHRQQITILQQVNNKEAK